MSGALPDFAAGQPLRAAALAALAERVRELAARKAGGGVRKHGHRMVAPGRRYAFQLAELSGVLYHRQGWLDMGNGQLVPVGDQEWNAVGTLQPCTVWLEVEGRSGGRVVVTAYDDSTPETNLRRRLGYVRTAEGGGLYCIQLLGGVVCPAAPRRMLGVAAEASGPGAPETCSAADASWYYRHAGGVVGGGYAVGEDEHGPSRVPLGYDCGMGELVLPAEDGGRRLALQLAFSCAI